MAVIKDGNCVAVTASTTTTTTGNEIEDTDGATTTATVEVQCLRFDLPSSFNGNVLVAFLPFILVALAFVVRHAYIYRPLQMIMDGEADQLRMREADPSTIETFDGDYACVNAYSMRSADVDRRGEDDGRRARFVKRSTGWPLSSKKVSSGLLHRKIRVLEAAAVRAEQANPDGSLGLLLQRESQLRSLDPPATAMADAMKAHAADRNDRWTKTAEAMNLGALRQLMGAEVTSIDTTLTHLRKSWWLTILSALLLSTLLATSDTAPVLLVGALGGVSFRALRTSRATQSNFAENWLALFPLAAASALAAFGGTLVIHLAAQLEIVGASFARVAPDSTDFVTLAVAFLLGYSERFLDGLVDGAVSSSTPPRSSPSLPSASSEGVDASTTDASRVAALAGQEAGGKVGGEPAEAEIAGARAGAVDGAKSVTGVDSAIAAAVGDIAGKAVADALTSAPSPEAIDVSAVAAKAALDAGASRTVADAAAAGAAAGAAAARAAAEGRVRAAAEESGGGTLCRM